MRNVAYITLLLIALQLRAQPNCEAFKYYGEELKYKACKIAEKRAGHYQFSKEYQQALDEALAVDSTFAFAYQAKSTAYLKSGDFLTWKKLMDKAVAYDPKGQLDYRGWCRYQFFKDYEGAIKDIELLDSLINYDLGYSVNGDYHLHVARALCYKAIGQPDKAILIIEEQLEADSYSAGIYDYLHLGVLYLEKGEYDKAIQYLLKQEAHNDLAENRFYIALAYRHKGNVEGYFSNLNIAKNKYQRGEKMFDTYVALADEIYLTDIEQELNKNNLPDKD